MTKGPGPSNFAKSFPGRTFSIKRGNVSRQATTRAQAQIVKKAADAENAVAQLRLALMYDEGDGVPRSA